jgi:hypothetical protein
MKPDRLIAEIRQAMPERLDYLERRAKHTPMSETDHAAVKAELAARRAYFNSPEYRLALARTL